MLGGSRDLSVYLWNWEAMRSPRSECTCRYRRCPWTKPGGPSVLGGRGRLGRTIKESEMSDQWERRKPRKVGWPRREVKKVFCRNDPLCQILLSQCGRNQIKIGMRGKKCFYILIFHQMGWGAVASFDFANPRIFRLFLFSFIPSYKWKFFSLLNYFVKYI